MNNTLKDYIIIISAIIIMALTLKMGCSNPFPNLEVAPQIQTIIKSDTIWTKDTLIKFKSIIKPKWDTIYKLDTIVEGVALDDLFYVRKYNDSLIDSNLTIYSGVKVIGILSQLDLSYKLKSKPSLITNNITTTITNVKIQPSKVSIIAGLELGGNKSSFNLSPYIKVDVKNASIGYRYGLLDATHSVGVGYKLYNSKK